ncbi:thermonuclease family protein [Roseateles sp.]|uniref:thermonuclease family protein n=1 Tax=Roseateles sp. TaxID=1971397 RepID=UPI002E05C5BF|nr:thermonuclease family protein [Roseateles sp.]
MSAAILFCLIVGISDGDTLTARCGPADAAQTVKVRLAEIDAPEKAQPFGQRSRQALAALCFKRPATVSVQTKDRYGRAVARVECDGLDASAEQVRTGVAWVFDRYVKDRSLYALQDEARAAGRGLWADAAPVAPWEWRSARRNYRL